MNTHDITQILLLLLLLALSAFFSSAETAMTTVSAIRVRALASEGDQRALRLQGILADSGKMLSAILIGNNIVNISASALATTLTLRFFGSAAVGLATGLMTLLVLIFGEITPKTMAAASALELSLAYAGTIRLLMTVMTPVIFIVEHLSGFVLRLLKADQRRGRAAMTEQELRTLVDVSHEDGAIREQEHEVINNVLDFMRSLAREIMVPRIDMVTVESSDDYETVRTRFASERFTRLPVWEGTRENIVGVIHLKDFMLCDSAAFNLKSIMYAPYYTYEMKKTSALLLEMQAKETAVTIVLDEYAQAVGMITLEDILEELVGEIRDEYDQEERDLIRRIPGGRCIIEGSVKLDDLNEALDLSLTSEEYDSLGGYVLERLDHIPAVGEEVVGEDGTAVKVLKMSGNRIRKLLLTPAQGTEPHQHGGQKNNGSQQGAREDAP